MRIHKHFFCSYLHQFIFTILLISLSVTFAEASGYQYTEITSNSYTESRLIQNNNGYIVWYSDEGSVDNLYLYDGSSITNLTNGDYIDTWILGYRFVMNDLNQVAWCNQTQQIHLVDGASSTVIATGGYHYLNNNGDIVWQAEDGASDSQVYRYSSGVITQISTVNYDNPFIGASEPVINDSGQIAWYQGSSDSPRDVYLWDPDSAIATKITDSTTRYESQSINNLGQLMFRGPGLPSYGTWIYNGSATSKISDFFYGGILNNNGQILRLDTSDNNLYLYDIAGGSWSQITTNGTTKNGYSINDLGHIVWSQSDGSDYELFLYNNGTTTQITSNSVDDTNPVINNKGQIAFLRNDGGVEVYQATPTPDVFTFTDQTNVALSTLTTSNTITVTGINTATAISVTDGDYSVSTDGGSTWSDYSTSTPATVNLNDQVKVLQTSSSSYSTTTNATLTIGGVSDTFSVTTRQDPALLVTITVDPHPDSLNAPWILTGPGAYSRSSNGDETIGDLDPGEYTVTWGDVAGWDKPSPSTQNLAAGDSITFTGNYQLTPVVPTPPTEGFAGSTITINGSNFGALQGGGYVIFNGVHGNIVSWSDTRIVVTVPGEATSGCMTVVTDYGTSSCMNFTINDSVRNDVNGDDISDIILRNATIGQHTLWYMNTDGSHSSKVLLTNNQNFIVVGIGDINADGISDILWTNSSSGQHTLWFMNADGSHASKTLLKNADWTIAGTGDINGDGRSDILWSHTTTGQHTVWYMNADGSRTSKTLLTNTDWIIAETGDINADGRDDILWSNTSTGAHVIWFMKTDGSHTANVLFTNTAWAIVGTGDFNQDGITDILWRKITNGSHVLWFMNPDGTQSGNKALLMDPNMTIATSGDYNKDNISDILWSNISTGQHTIWYMNTDGTAASTKVILTNTTWTIVP